MNCNVRDETKRQLKCTINYREEKTYIAAIAHRFSINLSDEFAATATALGVPLGCIVSTYTMRRGRKLSLLITSIVSIVGWLVIYLSGTYEQILVGRIISGIATGTASVPATVYSAEIASPKWRSTMVTWTSISIAIGVLIVYIFGYAFKVNNKLFTPFNSIYMYVHNL